MNTSNPVYVLSTHAIQAKFEVTPAFVRISYTDRLRTQYEITTIETARRRWRCLESRGFVQAA